MIRATTYQLVLLIVLALAGCTGMKHISADDPLYTGHEIKFTTQGDKKKKLGLVIKSVLKPTPNNTFLWMRPALARYHMLSDTRKKKKFWKKKITGPVLLSQVTPNQVSTAIQNRIFHHGYFHNTVAYDTVRSGSRKAKYRYTITLREPYRFESIEFPKPQNDLTEKINKSQHESLLKKGDIYTLEAVKNERIRIDRDLKENGYIYFNPEFITLKADSVSGVHSLRTEVVVKPETPPESRKPYKIRNVYIHDDHVLGNILTDTLIFDSYYLISEHNASFRCTSAGNLSETGRTLQPLQLHAYHSLHE
jgi:outer membrane protein insertion porin family